ncbi:uncharacterized protein LOC111067754 [Drosophila obscura]|uniref:uncharacterized protein LOC111067754 n=1 Tax=Drosophila obscura TaxID=7282 RepID=UPI001BB29308|nr:uncharacterized protein LOC111067754 [Drosophila obscura]
MPRNTCGPSGCVANGNGNDNGNGNQDDNQDASNESGVGGIVKQEFEAAPPVCHRKSERRRVARDIFLVFEEQPTRRRGKGARGKNSRAKRKFGHLKVANTPRINKNILREIKTEPKCSSSVVAEPVTVVPPAVPPPLAPAPPFSLLPAAEGIKQPAEEPLPLPHPRVAAVKIETKTAAAAASNAAPSRVRTEPAPPTERRKEEHHHSASSLPPAAAHRPVYARNPAPAPATVPTNLPTPPTTPSVNPIFLWVKQDDTRIVEVRCEDYDKRNRIRLTKTTNGWRSMPRTDASSTRIVKFFHGSAAPLMKVKREQQHEQHHENELEHEQEQEEQEQEPELEAEQQQPQQQMPMPTIAQSLLHDWEDSGATQLPDELEDSEEQEEEEQQEEQEPDQHDNLAAVIEDVVVRPAAKQSQQSQQATTPTSTPCFDGLLLDGEETNASTKATKTNTPTYQSSTPSPMELQLCPKTGLFLPQGQLAAIAMAASAPVVSSEADKSSAENGVGVVADTVESLDCNTKNLKDLLDDADDLLQNCSSDNGSNGADLLDSLVKRSCEDNLVHASGPANGGSTSVEGDVTTAGDGLGSFCVADLGKDLPSMLHMDNDDDDAPKCLSFNEAGEIEGLNGELFLGIAAFEKQQEEMARTEQQQPTTPATVELTQTPTPTPTPTPPSPEMEKQTAATGSASASADEAPKDLSYKKREEVCPPSESRSQCAVTSSSDILKSPERELQLPVNSIPAEVETTSETIKNLILEQFLKLNSNQQQQAQQAEPMDLGKAGREGKLETVVVIHDDDEEDGESNQPLKKRSKASIKMDKDPDALTQLKMLISNPQWKVPDPILVPKDRLGAVLASPAREIPLLLTTRPELRLPEAFAYPEIIQNPNILVVTMEQLEAILKTEAEQAKAAQSTDPSQMLADHHPPLSKARSPSPSPSLKHSQTHKAQAHVPAPPSQPKPPVVGAPVAPTPPSPADSSLSTSTSTDLNATTLALLQQMLWLPYFGQLSQELFKTIKDPLGMQRKFMSNLLPLYNSQFGLQHLDELYKHCLKQKAAGEQPTVSRVSTPVAATVAVPHPAHPHPPVAVAPPVPPAAAATNSFGVNGFANPMELAIMQKLLQPQMPNFSNWEATKDASVSGSASSSSHHHHHQEHKRPRREPESKASAGAVAVAPPPAPAVPSPAPAPAPAPAEHKPRLTCKSLSNLLEPEPIVPLLNVPFDSLRRTAAAGHGSKTGSEQQQSKEPNPGRLLRSSKACVTYNPLEHVKQQIQQQQQPHSQQRKRATSNMLGQDAHQQQQQQQLAEAAAVNASAGGMDANSALWHPLFGSNPKQGYNSPWQWTTVTATGE